MPCFLAVLSSSYIDLKVGGQILISVYTRNKQKYGCAPYLAIVFNDNKSTNTIGYKGDGKIPYKTPALRRGDKFFPLPVFFPLCDFLSSCWIVLIDS